MICPNCGFQNDKDSKFCGKCGKPLAAVLQQSVQMQQPMQMQQPVQMQQPMQMQQPAVQPTGNKRSLSFKLGIITMVASLLINIFAIPIAIAGIIIGSKNKDKKGVKLNIIAIIVTIVVGIIEAFILLSFGLIMPYIGDWKCAGDTNVANAEEYYKLNFTLLDEFSMTAIMGGEEEKISGTYKAKEISKVLSQHSSKHDGNIFEITLKIDKKFLDSDSSYPSTYEFEFIVSKLNGRKEAVLYNTSEYNDLLYCIKIK